MSTDINTLIEQIRMRQDGLRVHANVMSRAREIFDARGQASYSRAFGAAAGELAALRMALIEKRAALGEPASELDADLARALSVPEIDVRDLSIALEEIRLALGGSFWDYGPNRAAYALGFIEALRKGLQGAQS